MQARSPAIDAVIGDPKYYCTKSVQECSTVKTPSTYLVLVVLRSHWGLGLLVKVVGLQGAAAAAPHSSSTLVIVNDTAADQVTSCQSSRPAQHGTAQHGTAHYSTA
jgi:hypothetical protein